jgi:hypothetical protein
MGIVNVFAGPHEYAVMCSSLDAGWEHLANGI